MIWFGDMKTLAGSVKLVFKFILHFQLISEHVLVANNITSTLKCGFGPMVW
jgi:hypothetical protein